MIEFLKKYILQKWWLPLILFLLSALTFRIFISSTDKTLLNLSDSFLLFTICLLLIAGIWQLIKGKVHLGLLQLAILFIGVVGLIIVSTFMSMFGPDTDTFADNLKLPENIVLEKPLDTKMGENFDGIRPDSINQIIKTKIDFQLYNSFQPGLYEYDLWFNSKKNGTVFFKAFEITQEIELSASRLRESSSIRINITNDSIKRFRTHDDFTIYEGDWGKPYGARFEIWFKPDNEENEIKILEKNYIIEGWMR
ncbi:hypothetical protein [Cellulophaga sp. L1A9]|uniref:hypothetical protein n=1 Tax=Cellulophaga sp. L1A9 TaxID=2686362 RepID=UPI00131D18F6|nr:hypothetical protein [Cellulophaga sp. L1A9]